MRPALSLFLFSAALFGANSIQLGGPNASVSFNTGAAPFRRTDTLGVRQIWEGRIHGATVGANIQMPATQQDVACINGCGAIWLLISPAGQLNAVDYYDSFADGDGNAPIDISGRKDIVFRVVRDPIAKQWWLEVQNVSDGSGWASSPVKTIATPGGGSGGAAAMGSLLIGATGWNARLAWFRMRSGSVTYGANMPKDLDSVTGYYGAWEMESDASGIMADASGSNNPLTWSGTRTYSTTLPYAPACVAGSSTTYRAGVPAVLNGSDSVPLDGNPTLHYEWWQSDGPSMLRWSSHSTVNPQISGSMFGSYTFGLKVTDSTGLSSSCSVKHGFVPTDKKGVILISNPEHAKIFGAVPGGGGFLGGSLRHGVGPWKYYDAGLIREADTILSVMSTHFSNASFTVPLAGTISVANTCTNPDGYVSSTCATVTGTGTHFKDDFCAGGTTPENTNPGDSSARELTYMLIWYRSSLYPGTFGRRVMPLKSCDSDTQITLGRYANNETWSWVTLTDAMDTSGDVGGVSAGLQYSRWDPVISQWWQFSNSPANYYDNVMALYLAYYRTGLDQYRDAARTLADNWFTTPKLDRGSGTSGQGYWQWNEQRQMSILGVILRALDGKPEYWTGIRRILNSRESDIIATGDIGDTRNAAYQLIWTAVQAMTDPDTTPTTGARAHAQASLATAMTNKWTPNRQADGAFLKRSPGGNYSWGGFQQNMTGTATVTSGSTAVTGSGTNYLTVSSGETCWFGGLSLTSGGDVVTTGTTGGGNTFLHARFFGDWFPEPTRVYIGGVLGTRKSSIAAVTTYRDWAWEPNVLAVRGVGGGVEPTTSIDVGGYIWFSNSSTSSPFTASGGNNGDVAAYRISDVTDDTHITLRRAYTGTGGSKHYACTYSNGQLGYGVQPFMLGFLGNGMYLASAASTQNGRTTLAATYKTYAYGVASWLANNAYIPTYNGSPLGGTYYAKVFPNCEGPDIAPSCFDAGFGAGATVTNTAEMFHAYSLAALLDPAATVAADGSIVMPPSKKTDYDNRFSLLYGKPTTTDGTVPESVSYLDALESYWPDPNSLYTPKWFGYLYGIGANWSYPAARVGGLASQAMTTTSVWLGTPSSTNAACTTWSLSVVSPDGTVGSPTSCTTASCNISADARMTGALLRANCLAVNGTTVLRTIESPFSVQ